MPSTHTSLHYHVVFSTKNREPWFGATFLPDLHAYLGGTVRGLEGMAHAVGGVADHVHVLMGLKATHRLADVMREVKAESSRWVKSKSPAKGFAWQEGYGAFSVSAGDIEGVRAYVLSQEEHHRRKTFREEYVELLQRGMVEYDERYLW